MIEEKRLKKEKKAKKCKASVEKSEVNERSLMDVNSEEDSCVRPDEKAGKKKRKKNVTECLFNATNDEDIGQTTKKKKKEKKQVGDYNMEAHKKKQKKESTSTNLEPADIDEEEEQPKKKKKKKNTADKSTTDAIDENLVHKKHKKSTINGTENQETAEETGDIEGVKKNKMASTPEKKAKKREHGNKMTLTEMKDDDVKKKKKKSKTDDINMEGVEMKKKKDQKTSVECADVEETQKKKKKKIKKHNVKQDVSDEEQSDENLTGTEQKTKKRKERSTVVEAPVEDQCSENSTKRKKKKKVKEEVEEQNVTHAEVVFQSVKKGNTDEVTINQCPLAQERRQALQMEVDQGSQPPKASSPSGLGQWSTAQFDSSEKQQKFLRLMGGFKKGFQPAAATATRANMALGKDGQQQLQQKLLDEFDRAHSRRIDSSNRGAGIGFTAPANKTFFIDVNASRSVRFDD